MEKNGTFFFKNGKERNVPNRKEQSAQPCQNYKYADGNFFYFFFKYKKIAKETKKLILNVVQKLVADHANTMSA